MNIIDTRDLNKRLEELQSLKEDIDSAKEALEEAQKDYDDCEDEDDKEELLETIEDAKTDLESAEANFLQDEIDELTELESIESEVPDFYHGATLIEDRDFEEYCHQLVEDIGDLPIELPSYIVIDWEATANNLRMDYSTIEYQGTEYLYRC